MRRSGKKLSELKSVMTRYPQAMVNIRVTNEAKVAFYTDSKVKKLLRETEREIGDGGRLVIRPSGTEPLIRVMAEGEDYERTLAIVERTAAELEALLSAY
jgi:phosphoglucosamine mutase